MALRREIARRAVETAPTESEFLQLLDDAEIDIACIGTGRHASAEHTLDLADRYPQRFIPWARITANEGMDGVRRLEHLVRERGLKGLEISCFRAHRSDHAPAYYPLYAKCVELGVAPYLLRVALIGVVAQRLVRTLCHHCKKPTEISEDQWTSLVAPMRPRRPAKVYVPVGCDECRQTGYLGRIGIYEVMRLSDDLRRHITADTDSRRMRDAALKGGMLPLRISGAQKVAAGVTTAAEVFTAVQGDDPI